MPADNTPIIIEKTLMRFPAPLWVSFNCVLLPLKRISKAKAPQRRPQLHP
jgi:hypothetical protein